MQQDSNAVFLPVFLIRDKISEFFQQTFNRRLQESWALMNFDLCCSPNLRQSLNWLNLQKRNVKQNLTSSTDSVKDPDKQVGWIRGNQAISTCRSSFHCTFSAPRTAKRQTDPTHGTVEGRLQAAQVPILSQAKSSIPEQRHNSHKHSFVRMLLPYAEIQGRELLHSKQLPSNPWKQTSPAWTF